MRKLNLAAVIFILIISGMAGGALVNLFFQNSVYANSGPGDIVAKSVTIVDKQGNPRAGIGFAKGEPVIYLRDRKGAFRISLALAFEGPQLVFRDGANKMQLFLKSRTDGVSLLGLTSKGGKPRLTIAYNPHQGPAIGLYDEDNVGRAVVSVTRGTPSVTLLNEDKKPAIAMTSKKGKGALLALWNNNHDPGISLGLLNSQPTFFMYRPQRTGLLFNLAGGRPALALMNNGAPVWSATGDIPTAPDMPLTDDLMRELLR